MREVIEHHGCGQSPKHRGHLIDHGAVDVELHVPAKFGDAFRERLDHFGRDSARTRVRKAEANATDTASVICLELGIRDRRRDDSNAARVRPELRYRVEGHSVVGGIIAGLHDDNTRRPNPLLQQPVVLHGCVRRCHPRVRWHGKARWVVGVHVAVGGIGWRPELGRFGADRVRHLLGVTLLNVGSRGHCRDCPNRGSLDKRTTCNHFFLPICLGFNEAIHSAEHSEGRRVVPVAGNERAVTHSTNVR